MHIKKSLSIAALSALIGVPALGATNAHASTNVSQQVKYEKEASGSHGYEPVFNNGKGPVDDIGDTTHAKNLTKAQAEQYNSGNTNSINSQETQNNSSSNSSQYPTNSLPQTGEHQSQKAMTIASILISSGLGFAAMDFLKNSKRKGTAEYALVHDPSAFDIKDKEIKSKYAKLLK